MGAGASSARHVSIQDIQESLDTATVENVSQMIGRLSSHQFETLANAMALQQTHARKPLRRAVRKVDFIVSQGMPALLDDDAAIWATEVRGGMMNGAIPRDSMVAQKVKAADDYFVHLCTGSAKTDIIQTVTGLSEHVVYVHRYRQSDKCYSEDVVVRQDEDAGATWLIFQRGFDVESGVGIPVAEIYAEEDLEGSAARWTAPKVNLDVHRKTNKGIDWGCSEYGRVYSNAQCVTMCVEIPWQGTPANVRRRTRGMLDSVRHQQRELTELWQIASRSDNVTRALNELKDNLEGIFKERASILIDFEKELFQEAERCELAQVASIVAEQLDVILKEVEDNFIQMTSALSSDSLLAFKLLENTDSTLEVRSEFKTITRAWIGDRDGVWAESGIGKDVTTKVAQALKKGSLRFGADEAMHMTGRLYTDHAKHQGKKRALLVEFEAGNAGLRNGEEASLAFLRSTVYEYLEVDRQGKALRKRMNDMILSFRGDSEEVAQLSAFMSDAVDPDMEPVLRILADDLRLAMEHLEAEKDSSLGIDQLYEQVDFRQAVSRLKAIQASQEKRLSDMKESLGSRLQDVQRASGTSVVLSKAISARKLQVANDLYENGFSLRQLLTFVNKKSLSGHIQEDTTTAEIVFSVVIPETMAKGCCYAQILPGGAKKPQTLMSHWWGNTFLNLVKAICEHASGRADLSLDAHTDTDLDKSYWLCIFGVNQHFAICHSIPTPCMCGRPKIEAGRMNCQMDKFASVMKSIPYHALALDPSLTTLTRVWVLSELDEAMTGETKKDTQYCGTVDSKTQSDLHIPKVEDAQASYPADKELIVGAIRARDHGVEEFNKKMSAEVRKKISILRVFQCVEDGRLDVVRREVEEHPELIKKNRNTGSGQTILQVAAQMGMSDIVRFLVERKGIDVNARSRFLGWTALHFAAIYSNPRDPRQPEIQIEIASVLLEASADPDLENEFGRTPIEEALCAASHPAIIEILGVQTKRKPDKFYTDRFGFVNSMRGINFNALKKEFLKRCPNGAFSPHPLDGHLFSHSVGRICHDLGFSLRDDGELYVESHWNPPLGFEENDLTPIPCDHVPQIHMLYLATLRLSDYARHRYPCWKFDRVAISHCGHIYRFDMESVTLTAMTWQMLDAEGVGKTPATWYRNAQSLYP